MLMEIFYKYSYGKNYKPNSKMIKLEMYEQKDNHAKPMQYFWYRTLLLPRLDSKGSPCNLIPSSLGE